MPPRRHRLARRAFFRGVEVAAALCGGRAFYRRRFLGPGRLVLREERVRVPGLDPRLSGFTIAQLSDLHAGPFLGRGDLAHAVASVNRRGCDLVVVTGDFITHRWSDALAVLDDLALLRTRHGTLAVFGNHDYRRREEGRIAAEGARAGLRFLRDERLRLEHGGALLAVCGLEDLEEAREPDLARARAGARPGEAEILLVHNPGRARMLAHPDCALMLCGHAHGSQIDLPWLRALGPAHPGTRFQAGSTRVVVSRGLGVIGLPLRYRAPAEVVFATLERA
jgi:predicted MPP superfamily phosphohydrolase